MDEVAAPPDVDVLDVLLAVERLLREHADELDRLNVFPVPDADTGRNVLATVLAARAGAQGAAAGRGGPEAVDAALRGARGNSGVLLSQVLRALLDVTVTGPDRWVRRLRRADELARAAVAEPVEGSLLTAVSAAASAAEGAASPAVALDVALAAAHAAVDATPTQLEVLARAGVVDAGARAFALVLEAVAAVVGGRSPAPPVVVAPEDGPVREDCIPGGGRYEVMHLLDTPDADAAASSLRAALPSVGDSVVVVAAAALVSVHVHTDDIGAVLAVALEHGRPHRVRVEDLRPEGLDQADGGRVGVVAVTHGDAVATATALAGATGIDGDDGAPSVDDLAAAVARTGAPRVVLLPGDRAALAAAKELAAREDGPEVHVVEGADTPSRVLAALAVLDPAGAVAGDLEEAAEAVRCARMTADGDETWTITGAGPAAHVAGRREAVVALLDRLDDDEVELVQVLVGTEVSEGLRDTVVAAAAGRWADADVDVVEAALDGPTVEVGVE